MDFPLSLSSIILLLLLLLLLLRSGVVFGQTYIAAFCFSSERGNRVADLDCSSIGWCVVEKGEIV